jgi:hypothetical protein
MVRFENLEEDENSVSKIRLDLVHLRIPVYTCSCRRVADPKRISIRVTDCQSPSSSSAAMTRFDHFPQTLTHEAQKPR